MRHRELFSRIYGVLPPAARSVVATARGLYLRAWREGPDTSDLIAQATERETWIDDNWRQWQDERLAFVLHRAATLVPFYRAMWSARRQRGDRTSWERLENWPILEKETLRESPESFVAEDRDRRLLFHEHTSGTTGTSIDIWRSRTTVRAWYALNEARWRRWYGVSAQDRWAMFGGQLVTPVAQTSPPFWVWNAALHQLYCSTYHLSSVTAAAYANAISAHRVRYALAYPSALHMLAVSLSEQGIKGPSLRVAIANAEPVYPFQRASVREAFGCELRETYGLAEMVAAAGECERGTMHLWPDAGILEIVKGDSPVERGTDGDLVGTGLINDDMPLIRYRIGDRGALATSHEPCACGRTLPALARLEGRSDDVLWTRDGRAVGRLDPVFKEQLPIREAQIIQQSLDTIRMRFVPGRGYSASDGDELVRRIRERMGDVRVVLEEVSAIPREENGKFRAVVCALSASDRARVTAR